MSRPQRMLEANFCHHITVRCNNREFNLIRPECRDLMLNAIHQARAKFPFHLYALCIMSNPVHYLIKPDDPAQLPRIMHHINWYSAMCFNRLLKRSGHFWEGRYRSASFPENEHQRALNTLRYIHANPKTAGMRKGYFYAYSNYGIYHRLSDDGLTEWHPGLSLPGVKPGRLPKALPALLPTLRAEEKRSTAGLLLGKPLVSARPAQKRPPGLSRSKRPV